MSKLIVLVGLPGSGKSTYLKNESWQYSPDTFVYSTDIYIEAEAASEGKTYDECFQDFIKNATSAMDNSLKFAIEKDKHVIWDQTNMTSKKRRSIVAKFPVSYYRMCYCIAPPRSTEEWNELDKRLASRPGKTIPSHVVRSMFNSYEEPELEEGFDFIQIVDLFGNLSSEKRNRDKSWSRIQDTVLANYTCVKLYDNELAGCSYHNSYHVTEMYDYLEKTDEPYSEVLDWAVLFHDIVYDKGPDKELRSAEMFVEMSNRYSGCTLSEDDRLLVQELILATINHIVPMSADKKLFSAIIRADLHGLSSALTTVKNFGKIMEESMILYDIDEVTYAKNSEDFMKKLYDRVVVNSVTDSDHSSFYDKVCAGVKFTADIAQLIQEKQK